MFTLEARFFVRSMIMLPQRFAILELFIALLAGKVVHVGMTELVSVQGSLASEFQPTGLTFVDTFHQVDVPDVVPEVATELETFRTVLAVQGRSGFRVGTNFVRFKIVSIGALLATNFADPGPMFLLNVCRQIPTIVELGQAARFLAGESKLFTLQMIQLMPVVICFVFRFEWTFWTLNWFCCLCTSVRFRNG